MNLRITRLDDDFTRIDVFYDGDDERYNARAYLHGILGFLDCSYESSLQDCSSLSFYCVIRGWNKKGYSLRDRLKDAAQMISDESAVHGIEEGEAGE